VRKKLKPGPASPVIACEPSEPAAPPPAPEIQQVLLRLITPSLYQPRRFQIPDAEDPELLDLARSIRAKGVIQPILLRPVEGGFELVVGERRVRASRLDLPELAAIGPAPLYIPAVVRELSDPEAAELTVEENLRRKDLLPLEEADGVHTLLLLHKGDPLAVAARLGQTPAWVACRARIQSNLSEAWKELVSNPDSPFQAWTAAHLEEIAKLAQEVQDEILSSGNFDYLDVPAVTVPELRRMISDLTRKLGRAPFPLDDETLHPSAGACTNCPSTTLASPFLFTEDGGGAPADIKEARCLNHACWREKCHLSAERSAAKLRDEHPDLLLVAPKEVTSEEIPPSWRGSVVPSHAYEKVKKGTEGAQPAMMSGGSQTGKLVWVKPAYPVRSAHQREPEIPAASGPSAPPEAAPAPVQDLLAERRAKHMNRRISRMAELTRELLEACDGKILSPQLLVALAHVFGTNQSRKGAWHYGSTSDPWAELDAFCEMSDEDAATTIWACQLQPVLASRLHYNGPTDAARLHREIVAALSLIGASYPDLYCRVAKELPEPKAWRDLPGYTPEDLEGEPPMPPANVLRFERDDETLEGDDTDLAKIPA
jgi:ParB/RepB/Spo0J family partition protein